MPQLPNTSGQPENAGGRLADAKRTVKDIAPVDLPTIRAEIWNERQKHTVRVRKHLLP